MNWSCRRLKTKNSIESNSLYDKFKYFNLVLFFKNSVLSIDFILLKKVAQTKKPIILSTGMASLSEIETTLGILLKFGANKKDITILHCNTEYPTPMEDVNLKAMLTIKEKLGVEIGYSDHTLGIEVPVAAVALGATVIEKHFTLDRSLPGPDQLASLEPSELKSMVHSIRNIEKAIGGTGIKEPSKSEIKNISKDDLTPQRKAEIEKRLNSPAFKTRIDRMSKKMIKDVRKKEMERRKPKND